MRLSPITTIAIVMVTATCSPSKASTDSSGSREACSHFRNVAGDFSAGILTMVELRAKLVEVHDRADIATPRVRAAATVLLAAITAGDLPAMATAVTGMGDACTATGN